MVDRDQLCREILTNAANVDRLIALHRELATLCLGVSAVALDREGRILSMKAHQKAGTPHAEALVIQDLRERGVLAQASTLLVTLEPCNHFGRMPPCSEGVIKAHQESPLLVPQLRLAFANLMFEHHQYESALEQLNELREGYIFYKVTDPTFLHMRGMPFFDSFINLAFFVLNKLSITLHNVNICLKIHFSYVCFPLSKPTTEL